MWIALAVITFLAGQLYLFYCLGSVDRFVAQPQFGASDKKVLSIAFSNPESAEPIIDLLERFSLQHPELEIILMTGANTLAAVCSGQASIGFLPTNQHTNEMLHALPIRMKTSPILVNGTSIAPLDAITAQEVVWRRSIRTNPADVFVAYLQECGMLGGRKVG